VTLRHAFATGTGDPSSDPVFVMPAGVARIAGKLPTAGMYPSSKWQTSSAVYRRAARHQRRLIHAEMSESGS
jgi:hypothetical protein